MSLLPPEEGFVWLTVPTDRAIEVVVIGECESWQTHWYRGPEARRPQALRCGYGETGACRWCDAGYERRVRYVLPVRFEDAVRVLELGRVQYPTLACVDAAGGLLGAHLRLVRERPYANAPIQIRFLHREVVPPEARVDVCAFVSGLGCVQARAFDPIDGVSPPVRSRRR